MKPQTDLDNEKKVEEVKQEVEAKLEGTVEAEPDELSDPEMQSIAGGSAICSAYCDP